MGKKSKMSTEDPILKKNFKYEKRKKQREQEKQKMKEQKEQEEIRMKELRMIEKKVHADIQKLYENEKNQLLNQSNKTKSISKHQAFMNAFRAKEKPLQLTKELNKNIEEQFTKNLPHYSLQVQQNTYFHHFESVIPKPTSDLFVKHKKITQTMKMEQQIKEEIKSMFSVKKMQDDDNGNKVSNNGKSKVEDSVFGKGDQRNLEQELQEEEKQQEPYTVDKKGKLETELLIQGKIFTATKLALQNSKFIQGASQMQQDQSSLPDGVTPQYQVPHDIVKNYIDYVHVQNNEEQSIEEFRKVVVSHMYEHQLNCIKALKDNKKARGFTNSKYLILTPYVGDAKAIFDLIEEIFMKDEENTEETIPQPVRPQGKKKRKNQDNLQWVIENKEKIEQNENDQDDFFRVGIKILPKKKKVVYFSNFDASDIIVASPIGLKSIINGEGGKKEISFLSSVEILYVDRASVIMMQNWDHLLDIFHNLNYMPKYESLKNSINQIRSEFLELKGRVYRQNIVFTEFTFPQLNSLKINHFNNWQGCVTSKPIFRPLTLEQNSKIEKNFYKIELKQPKDDLQSRFDYFKRKFWDKIHNSDHMNKIVLFVNSYFEFVKMKGFLEKVNASFQAISEHTRKQKIQSRVSQFNNSRYRILLLTERAYYFGLCQIKKQKHVYFYSLPKNAFIYKDLIENMEAEDESKIVCIYSKYDKFIVERLVGSVKAIQMVKEYCTNVIFIV